ncbi:MAG: hypothetical protein AAFX93_20460 [Verrucomicrobiota bacterium]
MTKHGYKQNELAARAKTTPATISRVLENGQRPKDNVFSALCGSAWPDHETGLNILQAWLEDERERAGRADSEIQISIKGEDSLSRELNEDLRLIAEWLPENVDMRTMITFLADVARGEKKPLKKTTKKPRLPSQRDVTMHPIAKRNIKRKVSGSEAPAKRREAK